MDTLVTLLRPEMTVGSEGQRKTSLVEHSQVYAYVDHSLNELSSDGNYEMDSSINLTIYKVPALNTRWCVRIGEIVYAIQGIAMGGRLDATYTLTLSAIDG